jgi:hypothetical protein
MVGGLDNPPSFHLDGLGVADGQVLLAGKGLSGNPHEWSTLVDRLGGNGPGAESGRRKHS